MQQYHFFYSKQKKILREEYLCSKNGEHTLSHKTIPEYQRMPMASTISVADTEATGRKILHATIISSEHYFVAVGFILWIDNNHKAALNEGLKCIRNFSQVLYGSLLFHTILLINNMARC